MKTFVPVILSLMLIGCAGTATQRLSPDTLALLNGKTVTAVQRESPSFVAMTSGKGMFAVVGVGAAATAGNDLVEEKQIPDPAMAIAEAVAQDLTDLHDVRFLGRSDSVAGSNDVKEIVQLAQGSDYALDVVTNGWSYIYDGFKFSEYFVGYSSKLRLIDVGTMEVVASALCSYDAKKAGKTAVSHDTLMANDAAYIKQELTDATEVCARQFSSEVL